MTAPTPDNLETSLASLTTWPGGETRHWQTALDRVNAEPTTKPRHFHLLQKPLSNTTMLAIVGCIALVLSVGMLLPSLGKTRQSARRISEFNRMPAPAASAPAKLHQGDTIWAQNNTDGYVAVSPGEIQAGQVAAPPAPTKPAAPTRSVIQKATIDLQTPDVRATFAKASHLISIASGEFIENTSLTGDGTTAQANLTLRVTASRLGEVLNQLRDLGKVQSENTTGEDVTSQVVDLEARLRNEQRIEKELLELLDKRADAPLKEILELRSSLSTVRQTIEQYIAQRERLSRLVSLASILVVIRAQAQEEPPAASITSYFSSSIAQTWRSSLLALADSIAWLLSVLIGGIIWWLLLVISILTILRYRRRLAARCV